MDNTSVSCSGGDCPGLNNGPKTNEHAQRFSTQSKVGSRMIKNEYPAAINSANKQNTAK